jgi:nitroimidazol reductase NimA-like FMN-containing flavoprotein (pyridoxamine 5'-phosphate oxidase superfamily)
MEPVAEQLRLPDAYGRPSAILEWATVQERLVASAHYWLATVRGDRRPHVVPVDGLWLDDMCYFGGDPATVHVRNLAANSRAAIHLEDADAAVIVEGRARHVVPDAAETARLVAASQRKYGYAPAPDTYAKAGVWCLSPSRVLAWTTLYEDATRFSFGRT